MAELLAKWLNEDIKLSQTITNFEEDFSSGYLFGELLYKFNQQDNFVDFSMKDNITTKVKNFEKLEPTLRNLQIKFDSQSIDKIMKKERGYALRLLYQLKMILEKVYPPTDITILRKTGKNGDSQPAMKIGSQKQAYNKMQSQFFKVRLQALNKPQKQSNMERHLKKFQDEADRQAAEAQADQDAKKAEKEQQKQEIRRAQINKLQRNAGFMEEWLQKGVEDWKQNMAYKKEREQSQLEFEYKQAQILEATTVTRINAARTEVLDGIEQFEQTLLENNINPEVTEEFADQAINLQMDATAVSKATLRTQKMTQSLLSRPTMGLGGTMTKTGGITLGSVGLRSKAKKPLDDKARKDRERRRMRMISDQMGLLQTIEKDRREQEVLERMRRQSKQEEELAYEAWRTNQCKSVIEENRKLREAKYQRRSELDIQNAVFKEKSMLDSMQEQMTRDIDILKERDEFLRTKDKEAKKLRQTTECRKMVEAIFDIANEAYIHQQKQDSGEIDPRNWHEWQQLFIEGSPIVQETESTATTQIDSLELVDYLENKGQWPTTIVAENKPKLADLLGAGEPAAAAKGKGGKGAAAAETTVDESEMVIDDQPVANHLVGDAVEQIINLNHEARGRLLRPKNPHYLNLKLCLVGYAFAGKKSQAQRLQNEYGLKAMNMSDLIEEALDFYEKNPDPIQKVKEVNPIQESLHEESREENEPAHDQEEVKADEEPAQAQDGEPPAEQESQKQLGDNPMFHRSGMAAIDDDDNKSEASEVDEELNAEEDFRLCGQKIKEVLYEGSEISDQLYVDLFIAKLRMSFEIKDKETLRQKLLDDSKRELQLQKLLAKLGYELGELKEAQRSPKKKGQPQRKKKRTIEVVQAEIKETQKELLSIKCPESNGWILVDFPTNFSQAMLLEKSLSGYVIPADLEPTEREKEQKEANLLVKPTAKPEPPKTLIPSGLDAVLWFDCKREECLRRALGRRMDIATGARYHIEDDPPSIEQSPLCEEIQPVDEQSESTACLLDRWVAFDQTSSGLEKWITQFGDEATKSNLMVKIDANGKNEDTYTQIDSVLKKIVKRKERHSAFLRSHFHQQIIREEEMEQERLRAEAEAEELRKQKEAAALAAGEDVPVEQSVNTPRNLTKSMMGSKSFQEGSQFTTSDFVHERNNIDNDFKGTLMALWKKISTGYKNQMQLCLAKQRIQRDEIQENLNSVQQQFLSFLHRLDNKQEVLSKFILDFNEFSDSYPDMREDDQTKEELHQRTDILSDELWEIAEERKENAVEERKKIMEAGWVESAQEYITSVSQQMMQSEVDKFRGIVQLMWDYYHAIDEKLIPETTEIPAFGILDVPEGQPPVDLPQVELIAEGSDTLALDSYSYPRLDELYKRAIKAQIVPDLAAIAAAAQEQKKGGKKDAKGKGAAAAETETKESVYLAEMKEAIKNEKSILRFRLTQIRNWTLNRLKLQREQSLQIYKKLDDWIQVSYKAENDAIEEVCDVIKEAIEGQNKIQDELRLKFMDFVVDKSYHNYIDPPPPKLAAMEEVRANRFTIPQLEALISELSQLAEGSQILNRHAIEVLVKKLSNSKSLGDAGGLPKDWANYTQRDFEKMIRNLDVFNEGSIDFRILATCLMLLQSTLPTEEQLEQTKVALAELEVGCDCFCQTELWFEKSESSKDRDYSHSFDRVSLLKEILFSLFTSRGEGATRMMNVANFTALMKQIQTNYQVKLNQVQRSVILKLGASKAAKQPRQVPGNKFIDVLLCE